MKDREGHALVAYDDVRMDDDIHSAGAEGLKKILGIVGFDTSRVAWCPTCKEWKKKETRRDILERVARNVMDKK